MSLLLAYKKHPTRSGLLASRLKGAPPPRLPAGLRIKAGHRVPLPAAISLLPCRSLNTA
jgi:hypothetical protein